MEPQKSTGVISGIPQFDRWRFDRIGSPKKGEGFIGGTRCLHVAEYDYPVPDGYAVYVRIAPEFEAGELYVNEDCGIRGWNGEFLRGLGDGRVCEILPGIRAAALVDVANWCRSYPEESAWAFIKLFRKLYGPKTKCRYTVT
jgi:hypothetical protein